MLRRLIVAILTVGLATWYLEGQNFDLLSQNCLHLGWGNYPNKAPSILAEAQAAPVTVLQEVMNTTVPVLNGVTPGGYNAIPSPLKGGGWYKEAYVFVVDPNLNPSAIADYPDPNAYFSRPPSGIRVTPVGGNELWVIDYHAVFGRNAGVRRTEVGHMPTAVTWFQQQTIPNVTRMVIGGDWNIGATDQGFNNLTGAGFTITPNVLTSLKRNGGPSQPYDHFAYHTADTGVNGAAVVGPLNGGPWWRANVSDHVGISGTVN
jgi:hypothetical protein